MSNIEKIKEMSKAEAVERWQKGIKTMQSFRKKAEAPALRVMHGGLIVGAGALSGWMEAKYPGKIMNVEKGFIIGSVLMVAGLFGLGGDKVAGGLIAAGGGFLSAFAHNKVKARTLAAAD